MAKPEVDLKIYSDPFAGNLAPKWPTTVTSRRRDGRITGVDGSVWLYRAIPLRAVADAKTTEARLDASATLTEAFGSLANLASVNGALRRQMAKSNYRHFHLLLINVPVLFSPPGDHPLFAPLLRDYGDRLTIRRVLMIGVRLRSSLNGKGGFKGAIDSIVETFTSSGVAMSDFDNDYEKVDAELSRAGCIPLTDEEMRLADSWFNHGVSNDPIMRPGPSHLSVFMDAKSAEFAARTLGDTPVETWPQIKGHQAITFASVQEMDLPWVPATSPRSQWVSQLIDQGALAVSIRGQVEPAMMTKKELEAQRKRYVEDIQERYQQNKLSKAEQDETLATLEAVRGAYGQDGAPPTLVDASVVVAFDGLRETEDILGNGSVLRLNEMTHRQPAALMEMWPASHFRANPHRLDLPSTTVAYAGATSLSRVGDRPEDGAALIGFTERDRQPAWWNPRAAYQASQAPVYLVAGASGSGKLLTLDTRVVTASGYTNMGDLKVGDEVIGRDGKPCTVTHLSPIEVNPELYRLTFSDGQSVLADGNHQWVVSDYGDRARPRKTKHLVAQENRKVLQAQVDELRDLAAKIGPVPMSVTELADLVLAKTSITRWSGGDSIRASLRMTDTPVHSVKKSSKVIEVSGSLADMPVRYYRATDLIQASLDVWEQARARRAELTEKRLAAVSKARRADLSAAMSARALARILVDSGAPCVMEQMANTIRDVGKSAGIPTGVSGAPAAEILDALGAYWETQPGVALTPQSTVDAARKVLSSLSEGEESYPREIARRITDAGADIEVSALGTILSLNAKSAGLASTAGSALVTNPPRVAAGLGADEHQFLANVALGNLALRLWQIMGEKGVALGTEERVMSTAEMLGEGLFAYNGSANFAVRVADSLDLPDAELPVDPYIFGAWLGDGSSGSGHITSGRVESCIDPGDGVSDSARLVKALRDAGYDAYEAASSDNTINVPGLMPDLRETGALNNKHIPVKYLRASRQQRLAVLQGLMDTDGTIGKQRACELSLSDKRLATDALELIRSLGIKASVSWDKPAGYRDADGNLVPGKPRHRIKFTTDQPVFRLPRKARRLPEPGSLRETSKWLYVKSIEPVDPIPARCITVDSPDSTYLIEGFIPTHNTYLLLHMADQVARAGNPVIIVDPKPGSDMSDAVANSGGYVASLDDLISVDGVFDPLRLAVSPDLAVDMAVNAISQVWPWESKNSNYEVPLTVAIQYGVQHGAKCIGEALRIAYQAKQASVELVKPIISLAKSSPLFRAICGLDPQAQPLSVADGITCIRVGSANISLPEPGTTPDNMNLSQRISVVLIKLMVSGSLAALTHRNGLILLDEAWIFLGAGNAELERTARLARSMATSVCLYTQRVSDATVAGIDEHISGGFILPLNKKEAVAACQLLGIEPTPDRVNRITAKAERGDMDSGHDTTPNWESMRFLRDPQTGATLRGTIALYCDINDRVVPVEITVPEGFGKKASSDLRDVQKRKAEAEAAQGGQR